MLGKPTLMSVLYHIDPIFCKIFRKIHQGPQGFTNGSKGFSSSQELEKARKAGYFLVCKICEMNRSVVGVTRVRVSGYHITKE